MARAKTAGAGGKTNWLNDTTMNLLVDYYTEIQFRPYGSGATKANTVDWLRQLDLGYLCIYAKGHSGYTSWPSSLGTAHTMLGQDMPKFYREATREAGTRLVLYYSGLTDGIAGLRHPEWRMKNPDGSDKEMFGDFKFFIGYANCPLSGYFDEWVAVQLRELIEGYEPDGIWVDGDWPGPCYCPRCQARFREVSGWTQPWSEVIKRPDFDAAYKPVWNQIEHEWRTRFNALVKKLKPDCLYSAGNVSPRREFLAPFDWRSGDFFSPGFFNLHDMARMMRWYDTLGVPYDAYVCDTSFTHVRKEVRSRTKTLDRMLQEAATVAANGGAVGYWTYPTGNGALVPSRMRKAVAVRQFLTERADLWLHSRSASRTAIVVSDPSAPAFGGGNIEGAHKALAALHRSPRLMDETGLAAAVPELDLIVLPEQAVCAPETCRQLAAFVKAGGRLLTTGASIQSPDIRKLLGVSLAQSGAVQDGHVFLKHHDEPTGLDRPWDKLDLAGAEELYPLYLSWDALNPECRNLPNNWPMHGQVDEEHPQPAGFPAAVVRRIGKGLAVHIATDIFANYRHLGDPQILRWLREIVAFMDPVPYLQTDAPSWVDVSMRSLKGSLLVHVVNQNPGRDLSRLNTNDTWVDEIPEVGPYALSVRCGRKPKHVTWEPGCHRLTTDYKDGVLSVEIPRFQIHGCVRIEI